MSKVSVRKLQRRRPGSGRMFKITQRVKELVEQQMERDDETTATQLHRFLNDNGITENYFEVLLCPLYTCKMYIVSYKSTFGGSVYWQITK